MRSSRRSDLVVVAVLVALATGACAPSDPAPSAGSGGGTSTSSPIASSSVTTSTSVSASESPTTMAPVGSPAYAVATITRTFDDTARGRTFPTTIYLPAAAASARRGIGDPVTDAPSSSAPAAGAFPLVLMAHGYLLPGDGYERIMRVVASHGYVVAAPELPHSTGHGGNGQRGDIVNQPADLSFVADQMIELAGAGTITPAVADPARIAVVGHSDGGLTATAIGYGHQFRDTRVAAVVSLTGGVGLFPGAFYASDSPPVLAVHARDDGTNPYSASVNLFRNVPPGRPRFLLSIESGGHIDPYMFATGRLDLGDAVAAFLDLTVGTDPAALERLREVGRRPGFTLEES